MAAGRVAEERDGGGGGGFYKCEECSKAFNRMASYEAHIRMHAQNELDIFDVVFNYSGKMHESLSGSAVPSHRRATRRRKTPAKSPSTLKPLLCTTPQPAVSTGEPSDIVLCTITPASEQAPSSEEQAKVRTPPSKGFPDHEIVSSSGQVRMTGTINTPSPSCVGAAVPPPASSILPVSSSQEAKREVKSLVVKVPLKFCSAEVLKEPVINLTKSVESVTEWSESSSSNPTATATIAPHKNTPTVSPVTVSGAQSQVEGDQLQQAIKIEDSDTGDDVIFTKPLSPPSKKVPKVIRLESFTTLYESDRFRRMLSDDAIAAPTTKYGGTVKTAKVAEFECGVCHRLLSSNHSLKRHTLLHTGERPFKCSICDKSFVQVHHRDNHEMTHFVIRQHRPGGSVSSSFMRHQARGVASSATGSRGDNVSSSLVRSQTRGINSGATRLRLQRDGGSSVSSSYMRGSQTRGVTSVRIQGGGSVSSSVSSSSPENDEDQILKCRVCNMRFSGLRNLNRHLTMHDPNCPFGCDVCGMRFMKKRQWIYHIQTHVEKKVICKYCNKRFHSTDNLNRHMLVHIRDGTVSHKKYVCEHCSKVCLSLSGLTRHCAVHGLTKNKKSKKKCPPMRQVFASDHEKRGKLPSIREDGEVFDYESTEDEENVLGARDTEGELADVSGEGADSTEESAEEVMEVMRVVDPDVSEQSDWMSGVGESEEEGEMSPLRLDSDDDSSGDEGRGEAGYFRHYVRCSDDMGQSARGSTSDDSVGTHYRNPHNHKKGKGGVPKFKCEWCGRMFLRRDYLRAHYILHEQVPHQCELCGKVFMSQRYLKRHLRSKHDTC